MRGVLAALIVINVVMGSWFGWRYFDRSDASPTHQAIKTFPQTIMLVNEQMAVMGEEAPVTDPATTTIGVQSGLRLEKAGGDESVGRLCTLVGAFGELLQAEYFVENLAALDVVATVEQVVVPGESSFWVYLPPALSDKEAMRQLHELQEKGFDTYIIPKGALANGISFGAFNQREVADKLALEIQAKGYPVGVEEMERTYQENWVLLMPDEATKIDEELWLKLLSRTEKLEMRQNFCPSVAHP